MRQQNAAMEATLSEATFDQLRSIIRERTGIQFRDNKKYLLESRVRPRLVARNVPDFAAYVRLLQREDGGGEMKHLLNAVTINETSFFRNPSQCDALAKEILPDRIAQRRREGSRTGRLWSAACSTGDEAYTLAILIKERIQPQFPSVQFEILATDIDTDALGRARRGRYRERAVRNVPTAYLHKYFQRSGASYELSAAIREMVAFRSINLTDEAAVRRVGAVDVAMCANVLIYFSDAKKQAVVQSIYRALRPAGYLLVGGSETLGATRVGLVPKHVSGALVYQRVAEEAHPHTGAGSGYGSDVV